MKSPEFVCHAGKGLFSFRDSAVESPFVLYRNPHWIGLIAEEGFSYDTASKIIQERVPVQLAGIMNDGKPIKADALLLQEIDYKAKSDLFDREQNFTEAETSVETDTTDEKQGSFEDLLI